MGSNPTPSANTVLSGPETCGDENLAGARAFAGIVLQIPVLGEKHTCVSVPALSDSLKAAAATTDCVGCGVIEMSKLSLTFLIVTSLALTAYFGSVAWRVSGDGDSDITGRISTGHGNGWRSPPAR